MQKERLITEIDKVLYYFSLSSEEISQTIYEKYRLQKKYIEMDNLNSNLIKGSVRAYMEAFSDYENPILEKMYNLENEIEKLIK